jgi:hypothetical protein
MIESAKPLVPKKVPDNTNESRKTVLESYSRSLGDIPTLPSYDDGMDLYTL